MQRRYADFFCCILGVNLLVCLLSPIVSLADTCTTGAAKVVAVQGTVEAQRQGATQWQAVRLNDLYCPGDTLRVQERSRADVALGNQSVLRVGANTTLTLEGVKEERTFLVGLLRGVAHFFSRGSRSLEVHTPFVAAGVRGTEFLIQVEDHQTFLSLFTGSVVVTNEAGSLTLSSGQSATAEQGKAPTLRVVARPRDAVQWALYYPPVLYNPPAVSQLTPDQQRQVQASRDFYLQGEVQQAFRSLANLPPASYEAGLLTYRASLLLAVGQVDEARADLDQALRLDANSGEALALQTIMAVVQNEPDRALQMARQAVQATPTSATTHIALSYAQQAKFDLPGARASLHKAVQVEPHNALAWARLAELQASLGEPQKALRAARKAVTLAPGLARAQTVLGFAYLTQTKTGQAAVAFRTALELDQADPLPRLGLGLAHMRDGQVQEGVRDLEIAASLDPNNALVRSYLGKAYYEAKRAPLDEREYSVAKGLDPKDPTPFFYDAIQKQTTNRPVEALQAMQQAIALNDHRAVYRSRLLLDADLAARSASLARLYSDLGFQQLALVEGWKSVHSDPTNFSAHRLLADTYSVLPRHEIARVSELLQSQLLQPLNLTPLQPRLAESSLALISAGGPGVLSFNEFNPLFNRDHLTLHASGLAGEHHTYAGEGVLAGIYKRLSVSLGYTHFETDGFRKNSDQKDDIANVFAQLELTPATSLQVEYRYRITESGDLLLRFFPQDFFPGQRNSRETHLYRLGGRHALAPDSLLLGSFSYQHADVRQRDEQFPQPGVRFVDLRTPDQDAFSGEVQHLFRSSYVNLRTGVGYFDIDGAIDSTIEFGPPRSPVPRQITGTTKTQLHHVNAYTYADISLHKQVTVTAGLSFDSLSGDFPGDDTHQFNPKFGVMWRPLAGTTIRAAAFRALKRTLLTDQTLEPTQVAGFNQFFDDLNLSDVWRYGIALDQTLTESLFGGFELARRELTVPFLNAVENPAKPPTRQAYWDERLARTYLFWTPHPWLALRAEYLFEHIAHDTRFPAGVSRVDTHRVPLGIGMFHPSGLSTTVTATYIHQDGTFGGYTAGVPLRPGRDDFWSVDATLNYRLPQRYGFITVGATNLFDEHFQFFDRDLRNASIQPHRMVFGRVTLALP